MDYVFISSRKNEKIIYASKLHDKKQRDKYGVFVIEGIKLFREALLEGLSVSSVFFTEKTLECYGEELEASGAGEFYLVTDEVFEKLTKEKSPQGIFAVIKKPPKKIFNEKELREGGFLLLEDVQNPLNLGAVFRCAYSLGMKKVILTSGCADVFGSKALRSAMGSIFKTDFAYCENLSEFITNQKGYGNRVICTALSENAETLGIFDFKSGDSIVMGNEGNGVKEQTAAICDKSLIIPMLCGAESLNVATACAVVLWEKNKEFLTSSHRKGAAR